MKIALCQLDTITGNIAHNLSRIIGQLRAAAGAGAKLAIFPEMAVTGYPPKDLLEYDSFVQKAEAALDTIQQTCTALRITCITGAVSRNIFGGKKTLLNTAALIPPGGAIELTYKKLLPTYDVFDEHRYFEPCPPDFTSPIHSWADQNGQVRLGISICEDIWNDNEFWADGRLYDYDPIEGLIHSGANLIINISASPFVAGKPARRASMLAHIARKRATPVICVNQVGGCDQIIFDGGSGVFLPDGTVPCSAGWFSERMVVWDTHHRKPDANYHATLQRAGDDTAAIHDALILGLRDYLAKTGFRQVIVGNSGGIDSATVITLATAALDSANVISVSMPGPFTSGETRADSAELARRLGIRHIELPIAAPFDTMRALLESPPVLDALFHHPAGSASSAPIPSGARISKLANENLQARIRGNILMWLSNAITDPPTLLLSTGNKSEMAVGYCTLYGDMAGGLALISDVPKMMVYKLARHLNSAMGKPIPQSVIDREPTAELAPNQKDTDSLPPYPVLDDIIRLYVEERRGEEEIIAAGVAPVDLVRRVVRMIGNAEYKRQQAPPGLKVTSKAFGFGRRMPIARGRI
ncbi:MAG: NAD+ synthase [bacterium]|nr:NAD+ synthase [Candidatus Sumerlaeota bacterium]